MISYDLFETDLLTMCSKMKSMSGGNDDFFCEEFSKIYKDLIGKGQVTTTMDTGTAGSGSYTGATSLGTYKIDKSSLEKSLKDEFSKIRQLNKDHNKSIAKAISEGINKAMEDADVSATSVGVIISGSTTTPITLNACPLKKWTGQVSTLKESLTSGFETCKSDADFCKLMKETIQTYITTSTFTITLTSPVTGVGNGGHLL